MAVGHVLITDDNRINAVALAQLVSSLGGTFEYAYDGETALVRARERVPDVVLLDIGMPGIDGYETCRRLRAEHGQAIRIIALTGWTSDDDRQRALDASFDVHVAKPLSPEELAPYLLR